MNQHTVMIRNCARCGHDHAITFQEFSEHPIVDSDGTEWTHWGMCDVTNEPVLQRQEAKQEIVNG